MWNSTFELGLTRQPASRLKPSLVPRFSLLQGAGENPGIRLAYKAQIFSRARAVDFFVFWPWDKVGLKPSTTNRLPMQVLITEMIPDQCSNLGQGNSWNRSGHSHPIFRTYQEPDLTSCEYQLCFLSVYPGHQPAHGTVACVAGIKRGREHARKQGVREEEEKRNLPSSFFPLFARPRIPTFPSPLKRVHAG